MRVNKTHITVFQAIRIWNNPVRHISPYWLRGVKPMRISVTNGLLSHAPSIISIRPRVEKLTLHDNCISNLSDEYFNNCTKLCYVNFGGNAFQRLPNLFSIALTLEALDFSRNFVSDITTLKAATFPKLRKISLQGNRLTNFVGMTTLPQLERLNLAHNRLSHVDELYRIVSAFSLPTSTLFLSHNPWNCTDIYAWVYQSLYVHGQLVKSHCDGHELKFYFVWSPKNTSSTRLCDNDMTVCSSPSTLANCSLRDIGKDIYRWIIASKA